MRSGTARRSEETSARVARLLQEQGFEAAALRGGFDARVATGYPTEPKTDETT